MGRDGSSRVGSGSANPGPFRLQSARLLATLGASDREVENHGRLHRLMTEFDGTDYKAERDALRSVLLGMVIDSIDLDPGEYDTYTSTVTLRVFATLGTKPNVTVTIGSVGDGTDGTRRLTVKIEHAEGEEKLSGEIKEAAIAVLREEGEMHYGVLLGKLAARGVWPGGDDPSATLLAVLVAAYPEVELAGPGIYRIKEDEHRGSTA